MTSRHQTISAPWYATLVVAVCVALGLNGLADMVAYGSWVWTAVGLLGVVALCVATTRMLSRSRILPTVVGAVAAIVIAVPAFARDDNGERFMLPTPSALRTLLRTLADGVDLIYTSAPPAAVERPLLGVLTVGLIGLFLAAEHIAVSWRAAAVSGVVLLLPWVPAIALQHRLTLRLLLAALIGWILLLALTRRPTGASERPAPFAGSVAAVAAISLAVLVAPSAIGGNGWGMIPRFDTVDQFDTPPRLNLELDLRNSLGTNSSSTVAVYLTTGARPDVLRLYTLSDFDGTSWNTPETPPSRELTNGPLWPVDVPGWGDRELDTLTMSVLSAETSLPLPPVPRSVGPLDGHWTYAAATDQILADNTNTAGLEYTLSADLGFITSDLLEVSDGSQDARLDPTTLLIPEGVDADRFAELARSITDGATNRYEQAVALQEYFRNGGGFVYDTSVQPDTADAVSVFLDDKRGYCVQFATAMVVFARSLDIPARLAVGYLPGTQDESGAYIVRGGDAHAWPELYFSDVGWVRFEPTPSIQTGARPSYTQQAGDAAVDDFTNPTARPDFTGETDAPIVVPTSRASAGDGGSGFTVPWPLIAVFAAVAIALLWGASLVARRRREEENRAADPEVTWAWLRQHVPSSFAWPLTLTPHEVGSFVDAVARGEGVEIETEGRASLEALALAVSDHRYAPDGAHVDAHDLEHHSRAARDAIAQAAAEATTGRPARAGARGGPRRGG